MFPEKCAIWMRNCAVFEYHSDCLCFCAVVTNVSGTPGVAVWSDVSVLWTAGAVFALIIVGTVVVIVGTVIFVAIVCVRFLLLLVLLVLCYCCWY